MEDKQSETMRQLIQKLSLHLRKQYYNTHTDCFEKYATPYGGAMTESIGAFPEFIIRGTFCKRSSKGLCSPCFYSRFPLSKTSRDEYLSMIQSQINSVLDDFKTTVLERQFGKELEGVSLVFTPTGSFFDSFEFPIDIRLNLEQRLINISHELNIRIVLHIESHCEDFIKYNIGDESSKREMELLRQLNTKVVFGFESADEFNRNVLYNKDLKSEDFESAITKVRMNGLTPGAFVFAGLFALDDEETHIDVINTIKYLIQHNVFPVIMFQNDQPYTITDVLLKNNVISLLEPWTVADTLSDALKLLDDTNSYWLVADPIGGPPEPDRHIFRENKITCGTCSKSIYQALVVLRKERNIKSFINTCEALHNCKCYNQYEEFVKMLPTLQGSVLERTDRMIVKCKDYLESYLKEIGG